MAQKRREEQPIIQVQLFYLLPRPRRRKDSRWSKHDSVDPYTGAQHRAINVPHDGSRVHVAPMGTPNNRGRLQIQVGTNQTWYLRQGLIDLAARWAPQQRQLNLMQNWHVYEMD